MRRFFAVVFISFLVYFVSWFVVYSLGINKLAIQSEDTVPAMFLPVTILKEGTFYADTYYDQIKHRFPNPDDKNFEKGLLPFYFKKIGNNYVSAFPVITTFLAIPVYIFLVILNLPVTFDNLIIFSHISASLILAFTGGFFYLLLQKHYSHLLNKKNILLLTFIFLFSTINFPLVSQALWQQGSLQFFIILGLIFLSKNGKHVYFNIFLSSLFFGFAVLSRPTAVLYLPFLFLLLLSKLTRDFKLAFYKFSAYISGFIPPAVFFIWYNSVFYKGIENQGYASQLFSGWLSKFPEGFLGIWLSPSKGILIYSPVFIFSLLGIYVVLKRKRWQKDLQFVIFGCIVLIHTLVLGRWKHWYGGWSFGYRMSSDIIPFLVLLLVPYMSSKLFLKTKKLFYLSVVISTLIQAAGIIFFDGIWHAAYDKGFKNTSWLWSIKDSEAVFNIRRILVKLSLIERACSKCMPS